MYEKIKNITFVGMKKISDIYSRFALAGFIEYSMIWALEHIHIKFIHDVIYERATSCGDVEHYEDYIFRKLSNDEIKSVGKYVISDAYGFVKGDKVIAMTAVRYDNFERLPYSLLARFGKNTAYLFDEFVHPEYRRKGINQKMLNNISHILFNEDKQTMRLFVAHYNRANRRSVKKAGFCEVGRFWIYKMGRGRTRCVEKGGRG